MVPSGPVIDNCGAVLSIVMLLTVVSATSPSALTARAFTGIEVPSA